MKILNREGYTGLDATIVICVYSFERWDNILAAVRSCATQDEPPSDVIVVVDHNPKLLDALTAALPRCRVVPNSHAQGLSGGRNTGVEISSTPLVAFLDDDATAHPEWLSSLVAHCARDGVMGAGGRSVPAWQGSRPAWFPDELLWIAGCSYIGMPTTTATVRNPMGGCMCVRRSVFGAAGGFHEGLGRGASSVPISCEETEFCMRAARQMETARFVFEPRARIDHKVSARRMTWRYLVSRCRAEGISKAFVASFLGEPRGLAAERAYVFKVLPVGVARGLIDLLRGDVSGAGRAAAIVVGLAATTLGYLQGRAAFRRQEARQGVVSAHEA